VPVGLSLGIALAATLVMAGVRALDKGHVMTRTFRRP
jgi:hypothetical protein